jgi:hypothetical protein
MSGAIPPLPNTSSWRGAQLKHRDNFTFTFHEELEGVFDQSPKSGFRYSAEAEFLFLFSPPCQTDGGGIHSAF